jgi:hypothetical protein
LCHGDTYRQSIGYIAHGSDGILFIPAFAVIANAPRIAAMMMNVFMVDLTF